MALAWPLNTGFTVCSCGSCMEEFDAVLRALFFSMGKEYLYFKSPSAFVSLTTLFQLTWNIAGKKLKRMNLWFCLPYIPPNGS